jgi:hypothetical protein
VVALAGCSGSGGLDSRTGVSRSPSGEAQLHYALCPGEELTLIRAEELVGGSRTEFGVPIWWQIESDGAVVDGPVTVGSVPEGWTETVPYEAELPDDDLVGIEGTRDGMGMSFRPPTLREGEVLRGTYDTVSQERFEADAAAQCRATRRGAALAGLLAPLVAAGALVVLGRVHRGAPTSWGSRQARRGAAWVIAACAGTFWTTTLFSLGNYATHVAEIALVAVLAAVPAVVACVAVLPVVGTVGWLGRRLVSPSAQPWGAATGAIAAGLFGWLLVCGGDLRWLPMAAAVTAALVAMVPADLLRSVVPQVTVPRRLAIAVLAAACVGSAIGTSASLSNSPTPPTHDLADFRPAEDLDLAVPDGAELLLDDRGTGSDALSFEAVPGYQLLVACDDVSVQLSGGIARPATSLGAREVLPCAGGAIAGALSGRVRPGESVSLRVVVPDGVEWRLVAFAPR